MKRFGLLCSLIVLILPLLAPLSASNEKLEETTLIHPTWNATDVARPRSFATVGTPTAVSPQIVCGRPGDDPPIPEGHYYVISSINFRPRRCLDKDSGSDDLQTYPCNQTVYQIFHFGRRDANGCFMIHAIGSGQNNDAKYLTKRGGIYLNFEIWRNRQVIVVPPGYNPDRWGVFASANGTFTIRRANDNTCLDRRSQNGKLQVIECTGVPAQNWFFERYSQEDKQKQLKSLADELETTAVKLKTARRGKIRLRNNLEFLQRQIDILNVTNIN